MKRGFPRPRGYIKKTSRSPYAKHKNGSYGRKWDDRDYPWPYTASETGISKISNSRLKESVYFKKCGTCGDPVQEEMVGLIIYNTRSPKITKDTRTHWRVLHSESGPYHLKCLVLNFTMCPHLAATKLYEPAYAKWTDVREEILSAVKS